MTGDKDHRELRINLERVAHEPQAVIAGHADVRHQHTGKTAADLGQCQFRLIKDGRRNIGQH